jgi:hypothetical protein
LKLVRTALPGSEVRPNHHIIGTELRLSIHLEGAQFLSCRPNCRSSETFHATIRHRCEVASVSMN